MIMHGPGVMDYNPSFVISNSPVQVCQSAVCRPHLLYSALSLG